MKKPITNSILTNQLITRAISLNISRLCSDLKYIALPFTGNQLTMYLAN